MTTLHLDHITANYGANQVLREVTLDVSDGEFVALLGPSGCGKTTILKIIAGLIQPSSGDLRFNCESVLFTPAERRGAVMVFQKPLLFPYLTVAENVAFGLKMRKTPKAETERRVAEALRLVQLEGYERRKPNELSGGQEQRVSLARALVTEPRVLLLDEPFSALDESLRGEMRTLVRDLQRRLKITTIFVTHDQAEAAALADRIALLLGGQLEQFGAPRDFYLAPATPAAAQFFGWKLIAGESQGRIFESAIGSFIIPHENGTAPQTMAFRPDAMRFRQPSVRLLANTANNITGTIESLIDLGARARYRLSLNSGEVIEVEQESIEAGEELFAVGAQVVLHIPSHATRFFR
jgi:putative spermidine/putrescine transport system ATP-binding protein